MPSIWQRAQSLFYPVRIRHESTPLNIQLELFYYRGRYILGAGNAIYSDGDKYRPLVAAFGSQQLAARLNTIRTLLVLGTGLASAVHVLYRAGVAPQTTLVEIDEQILSWAVEFLPPEFRNKTVTHCASAFDFIAKDEHTYDLIVVDIFIGRVVPDDALQASFLQQCKSRLSATGHLVFNYMVNRPEDDGKAKAALEAAFDQVAEISFGINKVYIATA